MQRGNGLEAIFVISRSAYAQTSCRDVIRPASSSRRKRSTPGDDNLSPALACRSNSILAPSGLGSHRPVRGFSHPTYAGQGVTRAFPLSADEETFGCAESPPQ